MSLLFFSYSHKDEDLRNQLETHLAILKRQGLLRTWYDRRITAGEHIDGSINKHLEEADIILCLLSPDFLASDYCYSREMSRALERNAQNTARVIPVILRHCDWENTPLKDLRGTPKENRPVMAWPDKDEAFKNISKDIRDALTALGRKGDVRDEVANVVSKETRFITPSPRSANLKIKKTFTDLERDQFLDGGFKFITEYFSNSLRGLKDRNKSIDGKINRLDAHQFSASLYKDGKKQSGMTVFRGGSRGFGQDISFNNSDTGDSSSSNGGFSLRENENGIGFSQLFGFGSSRDQLSTPEDVAEELWGHLIEPLQR